MICLSMCFRATNNVHFIYYPSVVSNGKNSTLKFVILSSLSVGVNNDYSENPSLNLIGYKMTDLKKNPAGSFKNRKNFRTAK